MCLVRPLLHFVSDTCRYYPHAIPPHVGVPNRTWYPFSIRVPPPPYSSSHCLSPRSTRAYAVRSRRWCMQICGTRCLQPHQVPAALVVPLFFVIVAWSLSAQRVLCMWSLALCPDASRLARSRCLWPANSARMAPLNPCCASGGAPHCPLPHGVTSWPLDSNLRPPKPAHDQLQQPSMLRATAELDRSAAVSGLNVSPAHTSLHNDACGCSIHSAE